MNLNIIDKLTNEGLKFPFDKPDWFNTFGIYCLINLVSVIIWTGIFIGGYFGLIFLAGLDLTSISLILLIPLSIVIIILILISLYLGGYNLEMMKNIKEDKEVKKPEHKNIGYKLKLGLCKIIIQAVVSILMVIFFAAAGVLIIWGIALTADLPIAGIPIAIIGLLFTLFFIALTLYFQGIGVPIMIYNFLDSGSLGRAFNTENIIRGTRNAWQNLLIIYLLSIVGTIITGVLTQIPCIGFLLQLVALPYIVFVVSFLTGTVYYHLQPKTKIK